MVDAPVIDPLRQDLAAGARTGRFSVGPDIASLDVVIGTMLFALRRMLDEAVPDDYSINVVAQLLRSLGVDPGEATELAKQAVDTAESLT